MQTATPAAAIQTLCNFTDFVVVFIIGYIETWISWFFEKKNYMVCFNKLGRYASKKLTTIRQNYRLKEVYRVYNHFIFMDGVKFGLFSKKVAV